MIEEYLDTFQTPMARGRAKKVLSMRLVNFDNKIMTRTEHMEWAMREGWGFDLTTLVGKPVLQRGIDCWVLTKTEIGYHNFLKESNYVTF
jgi:hypothetical protein